MYQTNSLTQPEKNSLKTKAERHIQDIATLLQGKIDEFARKEQAERNRVPYLKDFNIKGLDGGNELLDEIFGKINLYGDQATDLKRIQLSPYFVRMDVNWKDTSKDETLYIGKYSAPELNIYSWFSPIATLRFSGIGEGEFAKPLGDKRSAEISRKDDFLIQNGEIVFMSHESRDISRQMVYQKHLDERRDFLLPEIVAELDRLQDQIIRSDPEGEFLISGPAGSGKTTLALHRVAYLVLTPEFKDFFNPEKIIVFVNDQGAINYFSGLLPELGINGVRITTFLQWAEMLVNSRFKAKVKNRFRALPLHAALDHVKENNPMPELNGRQVLDLYRKLKQDILIPLHIKEGSYKSVYPALEQHYLENLPGKDLKLETGFRKYIKFLVKNKYLDEIDLTLLLMSLERPAGPYVHAIVDEVQNWLPEQLQIVRKSVSKAYNSVTFIGDIRQKTKVFTVNSWSDISEDFANSTPRLAELVNVYRNPKPILEHLQAKGYSISVPERAKTGEPVEIDREFSQLSLEDQQAKIAGIIERNETSQIGILAKYRESLADFAYLAHDKENVHLLTIEEAQGMEFDTVVIVNASVFDLGEDAYNAVTSLGIRGEFVAQDRYLYYVAVTRARERLALL